LFFLTNDLCFLIERHFFLNFHLNVVVLLISQIDYYEDLYAEVSQLEDFRVFDGWLRVDIKFFKASLCNIIKKWSWLFKEHLLTYVTNR